MNGPSNRRSLKMDRAVMESRRHAILSAVTNGELDRLKDLIAEYDDGRGLANTVMIYNEDNGLGVIHYAAFDGKLNVLNYLIEELGIDVDTKEEEGNSPLSLVIAAGNMHTFEYLLGKGADPNTSNKIGYTPLHHAAGNGYTEILTKLLSRGVDINAVSQNGTPLGVATNRGKVEALQILLDQNADPNLCHGCSFTPLVGSIVCQSLQCVEPLLEAGADPDGGSYGVTPLIVAAKAGLTQTIKRLIQAGANPDITNCHGLTPLEIAALNGSHNAVGILFPVTSRIPEYIDWSVDGVIAHVRSDQAKEQRKLKAKEKFDVAKLSGTDAFKKQDYFGAICWYTQAHELDPYDACVLSNRSMCSARMKDGRAALEDAMACISLRKNWPKAYYRAGVAYNLLKRYGDAQQAFLRGLELSPNNQELKDALREVVAAQLNTV